LVASWRRKLNGSLAFVLSALGNGAGFIGARSFCTVRAQKLAGTGAETKM
jgi:hypothetical protein